MSAPSVANALTQWKNRVNLLDQIETGGTTYISRFNTLIASAIYDYSAAVAGGAAAERGSLASTISPESVQAAQAGVMADLMAAINAPERGPMARALYRLREYMVANYYVVGSRQFTYGAVTASGSPTGTGTISQITVDEDGFNLECCHSETKTLECVADQGQTDKHSEIFEIRGAKPEMDVLSVVGSGVRARIKALSTRDSDQILNNSSYSQFTGTAPTAGVPTALAATTDFSGWVVDSITGAYCVIDQAYRDLVGVTQTYSAKFTASNGIQQTFETQKNAKFDIIAPYYVDVAVYRANNCDGTYTLTFGNSTVSAAMSTLNSGAWNIVRLTLDKRCYYKNFKKNTMTIRFAVAAQTTGQWYVDDWTVAPTPFVDGLFWVARGGVTPWAYKDSYTVATTQSAIRSKMQYWGAWRTDVGFTLPNLPVAPAAACSVALAGAGAGNVDNGAHTYVYTNVNADGRESVISAGVVLTVVDKTANGKGSLTAVAAAAETTTSSRKIYRSKAGTTTPVFLLTTLADNTTTVYTDNTADASLGAQATSLVAGTQITDP